MPKHQLEGPGMYTDTYMCMYVYIRVYLYTYRYTYIYIHIYILYTHMYTPGLRLQKYVRQLPFGLCLRCCVMILHTFGIHEGLHRVGRVSWKICRACYLEDDGVYIRICGTRYLWEVGHSGI